LEGFAAQLETLAGKIGALMSLADRAENLMNNTADRALNRIATALERIATALEPSKARADEHRPTVDSDEYWTMEHPRATTIADLLEDIHRGMSQLPDYDQHTLEAREALNDLIAALNKQIMALLSRKANQPKLGPPAASNPSRTNTTHEPKTQLP
jgi:hypothetical protein